MIPICPHCNGYGYTAIRNGDDDVPCPYCSDLNDAHPAPTMVTMGSYTAKVSECDGVYILSLSFYGMPESLTNSWCRDHHALIAMGRALFTACNDHQPPTEHFGYSYHVGYVTLTGWLMQRDEVLPMIPTLYTRAAGRECGRVLMELGLEMEKRRKMAVWMDDPLLKRAG